MIIQHKFSLLHLYKIVIPGLVLLLLSACSDGGDSDNDSDSTNADGDSEANASYVVTFATSWTAANFPTNFPGGAHFTALTGGTHSDQIIFWMPGQNASEGVEDVAETGSQSKLIAEVNSAKADGKAEFVLASSGNASAAGTVELTFDINKTFPLVTLVSMVAPSPDWFVGVHDLSLLDDATGEFKQTVVVELRVYDAGTEDGQAFSLSNAATQPVEPIALLNRIDPADHDFVDGTGLGGAIIATMAFERAK